MVDTIKRWRMPAGSTPTPSGEKRDQATAARLKGDGRRRRQSDLMFFGIKGEVCCVELNAEGGRLSVGRNNAHGRHRTPQPLPKPMCRAARRWFG